MKETKTKLRPVELLRRRKHAVTVAEANLSGARARYMDTLSKYDHLFDEARARVKQHEG